MQRVFVTQVVVAPILPIAPTIAPTVALPLEGQRSSGVLHRDFSAVSLFSTVWSAAGRSTAGFRANAYALLTLGKSQM